MPASGNAGPDRRRPGATSPCGYHDRVRLRRRRPAGAAPADRRCVGDATRLPRGAAPSGWPPAGPRSPRRWLAPPQVGCRAAQPLPDRLAELMRVVDRTPHRCHPRRRPPARPDRALLRDARAARLHGLGQVDAARHRASAWRSGRGWPSPTGCRSTSWATPRSGWSAWTSRRPSAPASRSSRS